MAGFDLILKIDEEDENSAEICVAGTIEARSYTFLLDTDAAVTSLVWDDYTGQLSCQGSHQSSGILSDIEQDTSKFDV